MGNYKFAFSRAVNRLVGRLVSWPRLEPSTSRSSLMWRRILSLFYHGPQAVIPSECWIHKCNVIILHSAHTRLESSPDAMWLAMNWILSMALCTFGGYLWSLTNHVSFAVDISVAEVSNSGVYGRSGRCSEKSHSSADFGHDGRQRQVVSLVGRRLEMENEKNISNQIARIAVSHMSLFAHHLFHITYLHLSLLV